MFGLGLIVYGLSSLFVLNHARKRGKGWRFFALYSCLSAVILVVSLLID